MAEIYNKKYKFYKFSKILLCIVAVPLLLLALASSFIMMNSKSVGGYPSVFGYTVIETLYDNNGYYNETESRKVMFKKMSASEYKAGDVIAYYVNLNEDDEILGIYTPENSQTYSASLLDTGATTYDATAGIAGTAISIGRIGTAVEIQKFGESVKQNGFTVYTNETNDLSDQDSVVLSDYVLGKMVEVSPFLVSLICYGASVQSFVTLVVIPVLFVLVLKIVNEVARRAYEREDRLGEKQRIRKEENDQDVNIDANAGAEPVNTYQENLARTVEGFSPQAPNRPAPPRRPQATAPQTVATAPKAPVAPQRTTAPRPTAQPNAKPAVAPKATARPATPQRPTTARPATPAKPTATAPKAPTAPRRAPTKPTQPPKQ